MGFQRSAPFVLLAFFIILQLTPIPVHAWRLLSDTFLPVKYPPGAALVSTPTQADLDADGTLETLLLSRGHLAIRSAGETAWESPLDWVVEQAAFTDLNGDDFLEVTLLVWRPFRPWPVDEFLPFGGRISSFHDGQGNSCHLILIGWLLDRFTELWAGSALADPVTRFAAADLDDDTTQELITLEGRYAQDRSSTARVLKAWEWNGFGFSSVSSIKGVFSNLVLIQEEDGPYLILTP